MNNHENDEEQELLALESLDDYIRRRGLLAPNAETDRNGEFNGLTRDEAAQRMSEEKNYLDSVIWRYFDEEQVVEDNGTNVYDYASLSDYQQSDAEDEVVLLVLLANDVTHTAKVKPLVTLCETVRRAVISRSRFGVADKSSVDAPNSVTKKYILELSLVEFDSTAVMQFIDVIVSLFCHNTSTESSGTDSESSPSNNRTNRKRRIHAQEKKNDSQTQHLLYLINCNKISEEHIVECLRISHYLQCRIMLDVLASVLESSIDSQNCMSICSLADLYNLQALFEASVNHVVGRLDALQGTTFNNDTEDSSTNEEELSEDEKLQQDIWKSLPHELKSRILTMRNVMRSSVIGRGSKVSGVFFSNGDEFLAIFRETLCDLHERLAEARERRDEVIREREGEWEIRRQRRGRWFDSSEEAKRAFVYSGDVEYALSKIEKQEQRIKTLETFYQEQKLIFKNSTFGDSYVVL
jgi:hypothetical protein